MSSASRPTPTKAPACPRCNYSMEPCIFEGREVDVCPKCGGLWCEAVDWNEKSLGAQFAFPVEGTETEGPRIVATSDWLECPACQKPLTTLSVEGVEGLAIDACRQCGGVWFDHKEWEHLAALRDWERQRPGILRPTTWGEWFFHFLLRAPVEFNIAPRRVPAATLLIIAACVLLQLLLSDATWDQLAVHGARSLAPSQWLTLVTHQFLHGGWIHLAGNLYLLYVLGDNVEDVLGPVRFALFYVTCGIAAALAFIVTSAGDETPMVGASGAVSGVIAAYILLFRRARLTFMFIVWQFKSPAWVWIGVWLATNVVGAWYDPTASETQVAFTAHLGGFAAGALLIAPFRRQLVERHPLLDLLDRRRIQG